MEPMMQEITNHANKLKLAINSKQAVVGIIGLGYVGLPLADTLHSGGMTILGFDVDPSKIEKLDNGVNYLKHLGSDLTERLSASNRFTATTDFSQLESVDVIIVCVPTPIGQHLEPDLTYVLDSAKAIGSCLKPGQLIILESTTYPRTTKDEFLPQILKTAESSGRGIFEPEKDVFVAFSPEREDPGRKTHTTSTIPKLVGGFGEASTNLAVEVYKTGVESVVPVSSTEIAEAAKILENVFRAVNIAMVNELKILFDEMDINIWEVIEAASTKPFGFMPFYPGPGLGGHCIPIDPFYLTWKAREHNSVTRFIELAGEINRSMPEYVVSKVTDALNSNKKSVNGANILIIGIAYKPDIDDSRETPAAEIIQLLSDRGGVVNYHDPYIDSFPIKRDYSFSMRSVDLNEVILAKTDCVIIVTNHKIIDYALLGQYSELIVDTRNIMSTIDNVKATIVKA